MARKRKPDGRKKKRSRGVSSRLVNSREVRERFLIVCEGQKTEPNYFREFPISGLVDVDVENPGNTPKQLVEYAVERSKQDDYDQVWCVFDKDDCHASDFNGALQQAKSRNVMVAYSNQAFELWYLLHFAYHTNSIPRSDYGGKLSRSLGRPYSKNDPNMYEELLPRQVTAIKNANQLLKQYPSGNPAAADPSTMVHKLVLELNRFLPGQS
jgi:hypothetical protein